MGTPPHILIVDDEPELRDMLRMLFEREGFQVSEAANGEELFSRLRNNSITLITLDLRLGHENGLALASQIRSRQNIPIIMITGKGDTIDRVVGLEAGADDYLTKPFQLREVLARVRAVLRRYDAPAGVPETSPDRDTVNDGTIRFDDWIMNTATYELRNTDGTSLDLTTAEFNLLRILAERPSRVMTRDALMTLLKGQQWSPLDRAIDVLIRRLRKKIETTPAQPRLIKTVRGVGYIFAAKSVKD